MYEDNYEGISQTIAEKMKMKKTEIMIPQMAKLEEKAPANEGTDSTSHTVKDTIAKSNGPTKAVDKK